MTTLPLGVPPRAGGLAIGIGLVGAAAFPPLGLWPLSLVSLSLFLLLIRNQDTQTARNLGLVYGLAYALGAMYWLFAIFGALAVPMVAIMAGYFGILATLIAMTKTNRPLVRAAWTALFAVAIEWLRGDAWYLRFPWYTPAHALAAAPMWIAPVRWLGVYGFSYAIWFIAAAGAFRHPLIWAGFLLAPAAWFLLPAIEAPDRRVLLVQAEGDGEVELLIPKVPSERVDLAVLPEYAYLRSPQSALASANGPATLASKVSSPVVFGAVEGDYGGHFSNVAAVIDADGQLLGTFPKQRPVPLMGDGVPGDRRVVFPMEQGVLGVAVCYDFDAPEVSAALVRGGATVFVNPTFDAMSWTWVQHAHHELLLRLRAVENDRWILRAASSGRSEVINPHGVPSAGGVEIGQSGFVTLPFGHRRTMPPGGQLFVLGPIAAGATLAYLAFRVLQWWRLRRPAPPATGDPAASGPGPQLS